MHDEILRFYRVLELEPNVSFAAVKEAYRILVKVWHPDRFTHDLKLCRIAEAKLKEINLAFAGLQSYCASARSREQRINAEAAKVSPHAKPAARPFTAERNTKSTHRASETGQHPVADPHASTGGDPTLIDLEHDADTLWYLGWEYRVGRRTRQDITAAAKCFRRAADRGHMKAQCELGKMYFRGHGVPKDCMEAIKLMRMAANQGYDSAQFLLGLHFFNGEGVQQDYVEAFKWFELAAIARGREWLKADYYRARVVEYLTPAELLAAQRRVAVFRVKHP
jgi:TPR repeat protein